MPYANGDLGFREGLATLYHLIDQDWHAVVAEQATALDVIIRHHVGSPPRSIPDVACGIGTQASGWPRSGMRK